MKKMLLLSLLMSLMLSALSCAEHPIETTPAQTTETATATEVTSGEMEETADPAEVVDYLFHTQWLTIRLANGETVSPYQSLVLADVYGSTSVDGALAFRSWEGELAAWLSEGLVPTVILSEDAVLWNVKEASASLRHFYFYRASDEGFVREGNLENASLADVYRYGCEHFAGERIYIRMSYTYESEAPRIYASYEYAFCADFSAQVIKAPIFDYTATVIDADGNKVAPYQSSLYFFLDGRVSDGPLMFMRMEDVLPGWIEQGMVPEIALGENSSVRFACGENTLLTHSGRFRLFVQNEDGSISQVYELTDSALSDVYAYGKAHLAGKTVYVTYGCLVSDAENANDRNDVSCIFQTDF